MKIAQRLIDIAENAPLRIHEGQGLRLHCLKGRLWITQENDARDIFLAAGESFTIDHSGLTLVSALGDRAGVMVEPRGVQEIALFPGHFITD